MGFFQPSAKTAAPNTQHALLGRIWRFWREGARRSKDPRQQHNKPWHKHIVTCQFRHCFFSSSTFPLPHQSRHPMILIGQLSNILSPPLLSFLRTEIRTKRIVIRYFRSKKPTTRFSAAYQKLWYSEPTCIPMHKITKTRSFPHRRNRREQKEKKNSLSLV